MKKLIALMLAILLLSLSACSADPESPSTEATTESVEETTTEPTTDASTVPNGESDPTIEGTLPSLYADVITTLADSFSPEIPRGEALLYDLDKDGMEELFLMYPAENGENSLYVCDVYTIHADLQGSVLIPLLQKHTVFYNNAGGPSGCIGIAEMEGIEYFYIRSYYEDRADYQGESVPESIGTWELYTMDGVSLVLEATASYDLLRNNGSIQAECIMIPDHYSEFNLEVLPEISTVTMNEAPISLEEYAKWLNSMTIQKDIGSLNESCSMGHGIPLEELAAACK